METKPTNEDFVNHLKTGLGNTCLVCDCSPMYGNWTDMNGEFKCGKCGMTYQIISCKFGEATLAELGIQKSEVADRHCPDFQRVPLYKAYWQETGSKLPIGHYMGDQPYTEADVQSFVLWLWQKRDIYQLDYAEDYHWDVIEKMATPAN